MPVKKKIFFLMLTVLIFYITGCTMTPIEELLVEEQPDYAKSSISGPLTELEYTNKIDRIIIPFMNDGETFLSHHLEIIKGNFPVNQEIALVESSLDRAQQAIEEIDGLYQPPAYTEHKMDTITKLNEYKDALNRYKNALDTGSKNKI